MATVALEGNPINTNGNLPAVGSAAPDFILVDGDLKNVSLADFSGKKKLISIVPSLDTMVCATSTRKIDAAAKGRDDLVAIIVSADLPFAMSRFCKEANTDTVRTLSMMRGRGFAKDYGVLIADGPLEGIAARAVVVIDEHDKVVYTQLVPEITNEPDYDKALAATA